MKTTRTSVILACLLLAATCTPIAASKATPQEALDVARNWLGTIVTDSGAWAGTATPQVTGAQKIAKNGRTLGYFCPVSPRGYIVVSYYKELAAVKAWSDSGNLDISQETGMAAFIKDGLDRMITAVEKKSGKKIDQVTDADVAKVVEINYLSKWNKPVKDKTNQPEAVTPAANYTSGFLLTSVWHQAWPYNDQCPSLGCFPPGLHGKAWVGCVATAGSQIIKYWCWPTHTYDWTLIPDDLQQSAPTAQINETARLCHEVGVQLNMDYECDGSSSYTENMIGVFESYSYSGSGGGTTVHRENRSDYTAQQWWELIGTQHNVNRPVEYRVDQHAIVCDGHRIDSGNLQFHMNYGWGGSDTGWYTVDALSHGDPPNEFIVTDIVPNCSINGVMSGIYPGSSARYFDRDATGSSAYFGSAMELQFLPNITATCTGTAGQYISFNGTSSQPTRMFTRGDVTRGIVIKGQMFLRPSGMVVFR